MTTKEYCEEYGDDVYLDKGRRSAVANYGLDVRIVIPEAKAEYDLIPQTAENYDNLIDRLVGRYEPAIRNTFNSEALSAEYDGCGIDVEEDGSFTFSLGAHRDGAAVENGYGDYKFYGDESGEDVMETVKDNIERNGWECVSADVTDETWEFA